MGQYPVTLDVDKILDFLKYLFSAPRKPFRMTRHVFNTYSSRESHYAAFYRIILKQYRSKVEKSKGTSFGHCQKPMNAGCKKRSACE